VAIAGSEVATAPTLIMLHGLGGSAMDGLSLVKRAGIPDGVRVIAPSAPLRGPHGGRAWWTFDLDAFDAAKARGDLDAIARNVPVGLADSRKRVVDLVTALRGSHSGPIVLAGFSQGAMLAADVALESDMPLSGLVLLSGMIVEENAWQERSAARRGLRVLVSHGRSDQVIPFAAGERLRSLLESKGLDVRWHPFDGGHRAQVELIQEAMGWLKGEAR